MCARSVVKEMSRCRFNHAGLKNLLATINALLRPETNYGIALRSRYTLPQRFVMIPSIFSLAAFACNVVFSRTQHAIHQTDVIFLKKRYLFVPCQRFFYASRSKCSCNILCSFFFLLSFWGLNLQSRYVLPDAIGCDFVFVVW